VLNSVLARRAAARALVDGCLFSTLLPTFQSTFPDDVIYDSEPPKRSFPPASVPIRRSMPMKAARVVLIALVSFALVVPARANTYGSVEPIANPAVIDTTPLRDQDLSVRIEFAKRLFRCGIVDDVIDVLTDKHAITTVNGLNTHFEVGAGGFAGHTNPAYVYTVIDDGPNAASQDDVKVLTDSLGYVLSQGSAFLLDSDDTTSFDFPANYVVLNFAKPPSIRRSAALFELVGEIDHELFDTDTSGYTQYGRAYLSLQSDVPDDQFIAGYVEAAQRFGVEYTPIVAGVPSLFHGGAAFPGNDWTASPQGQEYLARIPAAAHHALGRIRDFHLRVTRKVLRRIEDGRHDVVEFSCR
jgi:hypothetical protein